MIASSNILRDYRQLSRGLALDRKMNQLQRPLGVVDGITIFIQVNSRADY